MVSGAACNAPSAAARGGFDFCLAPCDGVWWLTVHAPPLANTRIRLSDWHSGLRCQRLVSDRWCEEHGDPGLPLLELADHELVDRIRDGLAWKPRHALEQYLARIPAAIFAAVRPFSWRQFVVLRMAAAAPREAAQMLHDNPSLLWLTADRVADRELPRDRTPPLLRMPRRELLGWAADCPSARAVRLLSRIRYNHYRYTAQKCSSLRELVARDDIVRNLAQETSLPEPFIRWVDRAPSVYALPLAVDILRRYRPDDNPSALRRFVLRLNTRIRECRRYAGQLELPWVERRLKQCRSPARLERLHCRLRTRYEETADIMRLCVQLGRRQPPLAELGARGDRTVTRLHNRLAAEMSRVEASRYVEQLVARYGTSAFPPPPLPGRADIVPVTTAEELLAEGREMSHCVGSYADDIMAGRCYIYRVLRPQRATLQLVLGEGGPRMGMLRLAHNHHPSEETEAAVRRWIEEGPRGNKSARAHA